MRFVLIKLASLQCSNHDEDIVNTHGQDLKVEIIRFPVFALTSCGVDYQEWQNLENDEGGLESNVTENSDS